MTKIRELGEELGAVISGSGLRILETVLPLAVFLAASQILELGWSLALALITAGFFFIRRLLKREALGYAAAGLAGIGLAAGLALFSGSSQDFYLPGLITGGITVIICLVSALLKRPAAAWTSHLTRGWPLDWYWHDRIRPAYGEVTLFWAVGFAARAGLEYWLYLQGQTNALGLIQTILGWPYTILLLIVSYLYGLRRLGILKGPSVEEFQAGKPQPWEGQQRGF